jgi:hypothetical protein
MLLVLYLEYLDLIFLMERLIHIHTNRDDSALLTAAALVLTTARSLRHVSQNAGTYDDSVWIVSDPLTTEYDSSCLMMVSCCSTVYQVPLSSL